MEQFSVEEMKHIEVIRSLSEESSGLIIRLSKSLYEREIERQGLVDSGHSKEEAAEILLDRTSDALGQVLAQHKTETATTHYI